jgi:tRNA-modifying protein YgfZ
MPLAPVDLFDRSDRLRMEFTGPKAAESLNGLLTNDVVSLRGQDGLYACALTPKGRIIADVRVFAVADDGGTLAALRADTNAAAGAGFAAMIRKYVNPRVANYADVSAATGQLTASGEGAASLLAGVCGDVPDAATLRALPPFGHVTAVIAGAQVRIARVPDLADAHTFDLFCERAALDPVRDALVSAGAVLCDATEWRRRRAIAAQPEWGADMDESTLAQEANMDALQAISYTKGCYTGQETVARVHFRGHVNRTLRVVQFAPGATPDRGTGVLAADGAAVGDVRSVGARSDGLPVGLAMLRREIVQGAVLSYVDASGTNHALTVLDSVAD